MIKSMTWDRLGTLRCAPVAHPVSGAVATSGHGTGVTMPECGRQRLVPVGQLAFTAAPQTYINVVAPPSAALHERSP